jgi:ABC-type glycerol-3-phosphate transport system permease component
MRLLTSYGILILVTILISLPVFWFLDTSLKVDNEYNVWPIRILPKVPQWENYVKVFTTGGFSFAKYAGRSLLLALATTILIVITSAMGGYAFSRLRGVPGGNKLYAIIIALIIIPGSVYLIPRFIWYSRLKLTGTYWPWILGGLAADPFFIFMFRQFFVSFPIELEDAAEVDGCGPARILWSIYLPNAKPVIATASIFSFQRVWGEYIRPAIYLNDAMTTLAVKLRTSYVDQQGLDLKTVTLAANVVFVLPLVIVFFLGQKHILRGMVRSGLKGV